MPGPLLCSGLAILRLTFLAPAGAECPLGPVRLSVSTRGLSPDRPFGRGPAQRSGAPRGRGGGAGEGPVAEKRRDWEGRRLRRSAHGHPSGGGSRVWRRQEGQPLAEGRWEGGAGEGCGSGLPGRGHPALAPGARPPRPARRTARGTRCLSPQAGAAGTAGVARPGRPQLLPQRPEGRLPGKPLDRLGW